MLYYLKKWGFIINFNDLFINERIKKALVDLNFIKLTEIQEKAMPLIFEENDILGCAQTGTGKTATFMIPVINNILKEKERFKIKALIVAPTRELAVQIHENTTAFCKYTNIRSLALFGGIKESYQKQKLQQGVDIVIATPGRLLDFLKQKVINLKQVNYLVLDEADRMLDMGFIQDVNKIISYIPKKRQTLLFSATMPDAIKNLSENILIAPEEVHVETNEVVDKITQEVYFINQIDKLYLLKDIIKKENMESILIFCRTKNAAQKTSNFLRGNNITSDAIHGDKTQIERQKALRDFKNNKIKALVATDIASRGIDIDDLSNVINFDMPNDSDTYIHRIGRTARNKKNGVATSFCSETEMSIFNQVEEVCSINFNIKSHKYSK